MGTTDFGKRLRELRVVAGLTQEALAERAGLSVRGLSDLERGARQSPHPDTVRRLAEALRIERAEREAFAAAAVSCGLTESPATLPTATRMPGPLPTSADPRGHNLPTHLPSLIGREDAVVSVRGHLREAKTGLLTLTGPGGSGKTRLALAVGVTLLDEFPDGVWLVDLAPLRDPGLVASAVASAVGVREQPGQPVRDTLLEWLTMRSLLLILDNCEHLVEACAALADGLLRLSPGLRILATSREPLRIAGEQSWRLSSLAVPESLQSLTPDDLAGVAAVRLFVERAQAVRRDFMMTAQNSQAVAAICTQLDGLPLAIELAAARVEVLTPEQIVTRLGDCFRLLVAGNRAGPSRHSSLRGAVEWSYGLLTEAEQQLFDQLSVFAGGCTIEAIEAVATIDDTTGADALQVLTGLVSKSLVTADQGDDSQMRYWVLETLRQFGHGQLVARGYEAGARDRHADYFLTLAEHGRAELEGPHAMSWVQRLELEHDNLRVAWLWAVASGQQDLQLRLAASAWQCQWMAGHLGEPLENLELALARPRAYPETSHAIALHGAGLLAGLHRGQLEVAVDRIAASAEEFRALGDNRCLVMALGDAGILLTATGNLNRGMAVLNEALLVGQKSRDGLATGYAQFRRGQAALLTDDSAEAVELLEDAVAAGRSQKSPRLVGHALCNLACAVSQLGDGARAVELARDCLTLIVELGDAWALTAAILCVGVAAQVQGEHERAVRLFGAADSAAVTIGAAAMPTVQKAAHRSMAASREHMGVSAFEAAWTNGLALSTRKAIEFALEQVDDSSMLIRRYPPT